MPGLLPSHPHTEDILICQEWGLGPSRWLGTQAWQLKRAEPQLWPMLALIWDESPTSLLPTSVFLGLAKEPPTPEGCHKDCERHQSFALPLTAQEQRGPSLEPAGSQQLQVGLRFLAIHPHLSHPPRWYSCLSPLSTWNTNPLSSWSQRKAQHFMSPNPRSLSDPSQVHNGVGLQSASHNDSFLL